MIPALFAKSAACVDPFIYALNHPKIRKEIFNRVYRRIFHPPTTISATRRAANILFDHQLNEGLNRSALRDISRHCSSTVRRSAAQSSVLVHQNDETNIENGQIRTSQLPLPYNRFKCKSSLIAPGILRYLTQRLIFLKFNPNLYNDFFSF